jgi:serine protease AprX
MSAGTIGSSTHQRSRRAAWSLVAVALAAGSVLPAVSPEPVGSTGSINVIVRELEPASSTAEAVVRTLGGVVGRHIDLIGGFTASVPVANLGSLGASPAVEAVTPDGSIHLLGNSFGENTEAAAYDGSMPHVLRAIGADSFWSAGYTGSGVDVALLDSGVVGVDGLTAGGKVVNGPDLSFESQSDTFRYLDTYGHGTHMAGIIAGRDSVGPTYPKSVDDRYFTGVAPNARILNVKVGSYDGAVDVSQVLAAIDWIVQHKTDNGLNVRVLNISFGTDSTQGYLLDPLAFAVEQAWRRGIVVVVATGNDGNFKPLRDPAYDPFVIAVGASNTQGTTSLADDTVASFSNCDGKGRNVDLIAPGVSILGLRNPGSYADTTYPGAQVGTRFFKGSGTSQAAAVVSGAAALVVSKYPNATPDQVKALLRSTAYMPSVKGRSATCYGAGLLDMRAAAASALPRDSKAAQTWTQSLGVGSLEAARGSDHLEQNGVMLSGEKDIFGRPFYSIVWAPLSALGVSWSGGSWSGGIWSGASWSGVSWSGTSWSGVSWSGTSWSGVSWSGLSWSDQAWNGVSWSGGTWSGTSWSGVSWSGTSWSGDGWLGQSWG